MAVQTKAVIKSYFTRGSKPTQQEYVDLIDSYQDTGSSDAFTAIGQALVNASTQASARFAIGLDFVTTAQAIAGEIATGSMNPVLVRNQVQTLGAFATTAQAVSGLAATGYMNPVLTRNAIEAMGENGWIPIKTVTASNVTSVDFVNGSGGVVLDSTYRNYVVLISALIPATDNANLYMRTSSNGGSSYDSGGTDYNSAGISAVNGGAATGLGGNAAEYSLASSLGNFAAENTSVVVEIGNPAGATKCQFRVWAATTDASAGLSGFYITSGLRNAASDVDAIRFYMSTGNITSGYFTLYGVANAP